MNIKRAPEIEAVYDQKIQDLMTGKTEMRAVKYTQKRTRTHLSDVTSLCILQPYYHRVMVSVLPPSYTSKGGIHLGCHPVLRNERFWL